MFDDHEESVIDVVARDDKRFIEYLGVVRRRNSWRVYFFFSSRRRHTRFDCDWSSDVCSSDLWRGRNAKRWPHSVMMRSSWNASSRAHATSRSRCLVIGTATSFTWASANAPLDRKSVV